MAEVWQRENQIFREGTIHKNIETLVLKPTFSAEVENRMIDKRYYIGNLEFFRHYIADFPTDAEKLSFMDGVNCGKNELLNSQKDINNDAYKIGTIVKSHSMYAILFEYPREIRTELSFIQALADKNYLEIQFDNVRCDLEKSITPDFDYIEAQNRLDSIKGAIEENNETLALYKKGYILGKICNLGEITKTIDRLEAENITYSESIHKIQKSILVESLSMDKYVSAHHSLTAFHHAADTLKQNKTKIPWFNFLKRYSMNKVIKEYESKIFHQLDEIKKYDGAIRQYTTSDGQCQYLSEIITDINQELDIDKATIEQLKRSVRSTGFLIDKNKRSLKQYQIDTYGISMDSINSVNDISESCSSTLVSLMEKASGERLEELRKYYYELIVNDDMYYGIYPSHLKSMQYPQNLVEAIKKIDDLNGCYDELRQINLTTKLCEMTMKGATLEEIWGHKDDIAIDIENLYEANSFKSYPLEDFTLQSNEKEPKYEYADNECDNEDIEL